MRKSLTDLGRETVFKIMRCSFRVAGVTLALIWLFQASAVAGIYKWRDDQGKLHFTDDRAKIPPKYRENTQKFKGVYEPKPKVEAPPEEELKTAFEEYGEVTSVKIVIDRETGRSKGFAFVEMADDSSANAAIKDLNGKEMDDRAIKVNEARPREDRR